MKNQQRTVLSKKMLALFLALALLFSLGTQFSNVLVVSAVENDTYYPDESWNIM